MIKFRWIGWAGHVALKEEVRNKYETLVGKPEDKKLLGRPRYRVDDIKTHFSETGCQDLT